MKTRLTVLTVLAVLFLSSLIVTRGVATNGEVGTWASATEVPLQVNKVQAGSWMTMSLTRHKHLELGRQWFRRQIVGRWVQTARFCVGMEVRGAW